MKIAFYLCTWYLAILVPALAGYRWMRTLGLDETAAWTCGRIVALVSVTWVAWLCGYAGFNQWSTLGMVMLTGGAIAALWRSSIHFGQWRKIVRTELVFVLAFLVIILVRLRIPEIRGTEKPMDMGILTTLLRTEQFPPSDFWLAGFELNYYYWGQLLWVIPIRLSGLPVEISYNLVVATVGALVFLLAWTLSRYLGAPVRVALLGGFLAAFSGTADGLLQFLIKRNVTDVSLWDSSRQVNAAITEYPLFTVWLGDLHGHFIVMPIVLTVILTMLALRRRRFDIRGVVTIAVCCGAAVMTNPWSLVSVVAVIGLTVLVTISARPLNTALIRERLVAMVGVFLIATLFSIPFFLDYAPPVQGFSWNRAPTLTTELFLYAGVLMVPLFLASWRLLDTSNIIQKIGVNGKMVCFALVVMVAVFSGQPVAVLLLAGMAMLLTIAVVNSDDAVRYSSAVACVGTLMLAVPEIVVVVDIYGESLRRMNTIFKFYTQAWVLIAVSLPVLLYRAYASEKRIATYLTLVMLISVPHWAAVLVYAPGQPYGLDGLRWMGESERAGVLFLRQDKNISSILEAPGTAYSDAGRISSVTGIPSYLGWGNHELVWRGSEIRPELDRRIETAERIFSSGEVEEVRTLVSKEGIGHAIIGDLERSTYPSQGLEAVVRAGSVVFTHGDLRVVRFKP